MKKVFYYFMMILTVVSGILFLYSFMNIGDPEVSGFTTVALGFETMIAGMVTILMEERPRNTQAQIRHADKVENQGFGILMLIILSGLVLLMMY